MNKNTKNVNDVNHSYHARRPHWLLTRGNIIWAMVVVILSGVAVGLHMRGNHYKDLDQTAAVNAKIWRDRVDTLITKNARTIYLPKSGDVKMSKDQEKSVRFLSQFFAQITDFSSQTGYNTNYRLAKSSGIHDPAFWNKFMEAPYDKNGNGIVDAENIKMKNVRVQTIVTGPDSYIVTSTYIPYHNSSDLYQESHLQTRTYVFDVQGHVGNWKKFQLMPNMDMDAQEIRAGDLEN